MKTRIIIAIIAMMGISLGAKAQNKIETTGNVGIGTLDPKAGLHIANNYKSIIAEGLFFLRNIEAPVDKKNWYFSARNNGTLGLSTANDNYSWKKTILNIDGYTGNLGIGTSDPKAGLHIANNYKSIIAEGLLFLRNTEAPIDKKNWYFSAEDNGTLGLSTADDNYSWKKTILKIDGYTGNVGIGISKPDAKLHITDEGTSGVTSFQINNRFKFRGDGVFSWGANSDYGFLSWNTGKAIIAGKSDKELSFHTSGSEKMVVKTNGNVGIGTTTTGNHRLAVEGSIGAREIKVEATGWSDFVFYDDYQLPTLKEVENHIKENGHLKDIPSAKEVEKNGFFLGEMDAKLLQKIEELTLYTIEQEKSLKTQNSKIESQEKEIEELKKQNSKIQELVKKLIEDKK